MRTEKQDSRPRHLREGYGGAHHCWRSSLVHDLRNPFINLRCQNWLLAKQLYNMKTLRLIGCLLVAVCMCMGMASCSDDDSSGSSKGLVGNWYVNGLPSGYKDYCGHAYHFTSKNTVVYYNYIANYRHWSDGLSEALTGSMSGYYIQKGCGDLYNYTVVGDKIYIPSQGVILIIKGNSLYREGSSIVYVKK